MTGRRLFRTMALAVGILGLVVVTAGPAATNTQGTEAQYTFHTSGLSITISSWDVTLPPSPAQRSALRSTSSLRGRPTGQGIPATRLPSPQTVNTVFCHTAVNSNCLTASAMSESMSTTPSRATLSEPSLPYRRPVPARSLSRMSPKVRRSPRR